MSLHRGIAMPLLIAASIAAALFASVAAAQSADSAPSVSAELLASEVPVARPFVLRLTMRHGDKTLVRWPLPLALGADLEEVSRTETRREVGGQIETVLEVQLLAFDSARRLFPSLVIPYQQGTGAEKTLRTRALPLRVLSSIDVENPVLRPAAQPVEVMIRDWRFIIVNGALILGCVLLAVLALLLRHRRRRHPLPQRARQAPALSPHAEALSRLDALEAGDALEAEGLKGVFLSMSEIVRAYLGRRFHFSALDLTSSEIHARLASVEGSDDWLEDVDTWIRNCDLVKYANSETDADEARASLYQARILIERTKEAEQPKARVGARA